MANKNIDDYNSFSMMTDKIETDHSIDSRLLDKCINKKLHSIFD